MRQELLARVGTSAKDAFPFMGQRCDRVVKRVFDSLGDIDKRGRPVNGDDNQS